MERPEHLTDLDLADAQRGTAALDTASIEHLHRCIECRTAARAIAEAGAWDDDALARAAAKDLDRLGTAVPNALIEASPTDSPPVRGELWRLRWDGVAELAVAWSTDGALVRVMPATVDPDFADDHALVLPASESPLGVSLVIWPALAVDVPRTLLSSLVSTLPARVVDSVDDVRNAWIDDVPADRSVGRPIRSKLDQRFEYRALLASRFAHLADVAQFAEADADPDSYAPGREEPPRGI